MIRPVSRREMLRGSVALAALALADFPLSSLGFSDPEAGSELVPFLDAQPTGRPMVKWEQLRDWITPNAQVFAVSHYPAPKIDRATWALEVSGLVKKPRTFTLDQIRALRKKEVVATLECSGNGASPAFMGAIGNIRWGGTPLGPLLRECGLNKRASEVVFFGADEKVEKIRENDYLQNFARSLARADALGDDVLLAYEMNGEPLSDSHGAPLRLVVPGWFGIAWVKWLRRIELLDRRFMSKYMAREYVTLRGEEREGKTVWRETSVGAIDVKSIVARALRLKDGTIRLSGAAWGDGSEIERVEVRIDDGRWMKARLEAERARSRYAWRFWHFDWKNPGPGDHTVVSRAIDGEDRVQPSAEDPAIRLKKTYWEANQQYPRKLRL